MADPRRTPQRAIAAGIETGHRYLLRVGRTNIRDFQVCKGPLLIDPTDRCEARSEDLCGIPAGEPHPRVGAASKRADVKEGLKRRLRYGDASGFADEGVAL